MSIVYKLLAGAFIVIGAHMLTHGSHWFFVALAGVNVLFWSLSSIEEMIKARARK